MQRIDKTFDRAFYLELDDNPNIYLPLERKLGEKPEVNIFTAKAEQALHGIEELDELSKIYRADLIDKRILLNNINQLLQERDQVTLQEVIDVNGISKGLAEVLAYVTLVNTSPKFFINESATESVLFNADQSKYIELPQIIFSK